MNCFESLDEAKEKITGESEPGNVNKTYKIIENIGDSLRVYTANIEEEWGKFVLGYLGTETPKELIARYDAISDDELKDFKRMFESDIVYVNNIYQVNVRFVAGGKETPLIAHLSIKRKDKSPLHDWRDFQRIKNDLCGTSCEGIEIYPPSEFLVDTANQYHLWVLEPSARIGIGFKERLIDNEIRFDGGKQRAFAKHHMDNECPEIGIVWEHAEKWIKEQGGSDE